MTEVHFSDIWRVYSRFWWFSCIAIIFARMIVTWNLHTIPYLITTDARSPASQQHLQQKVGLRSGGAASTLTGYTASSTANSENLYPEETHTRWWELICHIPCDTFIVFFCFPSVFWNILEHHQQKSQRVNVPVWLQRKWIWKQQLNSGG